MLSRVANSIYWMSRYLERADSIARFIDVNLKLILDIALDRENVQWQPLVLASGDEADFFKRYKTLDQKRVVHFLTFDNLNPNSILSCILNARENARTVREIIPTELWETINELYHFIQKYSKKRQKDNLLPLYAQIKASNIVACGLVANAMLRDQALHFLRLGQMIERADKTARLLDVKYFHLLPSPEYVDSPYDAVEWGAVLRSVSAFQMYRKKYHQVNYRDVSEFLIFDPFFPRSINYCVNQTLSSLGAITDMTKVDMGAKGEMAKLQQMLLLTNVDKVLAEGLHEFIDVFQFNLNIVDQVIYRSFFELKE